MASASASSPSRLLATASDVVRTWSWMLDRGEPTALRPRLEVQAQAMGRAAGQGPWHCVKWNHNNQVLACGGDRGAVALLHESGKVLEVLFEGEAAAGHAPTPVVALAWGGRSRYLCTSGGGSRRPTLWDLKRKQKLRSFKGHGSSTVTAVAFAPDDSGVASGNNHGEILLHQLQFEEPALVLPFDPSSQQQANPGPRGLMSPSAISASVRTVEYWAMRPPLLLAGYRNGDARIWDAAAGACIGSFKGQHQAAVTAVVGSPVNNKLLATAGLDRRVLLFDANSRKLLRECRAPAPVHAMAFVPEGDALVVGCGNGALLVYDLRKPNVPCVSIEAHSSGQPVRALAVQATPAAAPSNGGVPTVSSSLPSATTTAATSATAASQQPEPQQPRAAPASASSSPKTSVGSAGAPQAKPVSPTKSSVVAAAAASAAAAKPLSAPEPLPSVGSSHSSALRSTTAATTALAATTSTAATTTGLNLRATTATQTTTGAAAGRRDAEPPQPPAPFESGFRWRDDNLLRATSAAGVAGAEAAAAGAGGGGGGAGGGAGAGGGEKLTATRPSLDGPSSSSSSSSFSAPSQPQPLQQPGIVPSAAQPAPAAAGGGGAAVPAAAVIGIGVAASPKEVAVLVEERVRDVVDEMKDELGRGLKGLHLELLRGQEGTQEAVAGLAAAVAALAEENRQLRAELAEMRALGY